MVVELKMFDQCCFHFAFGTGLEPNGTLYSCLGDAEYLFPQNTMPVHRTKCGFLGMLNSIVEVALVFTATEIN